MELKSDIICRGKIWRDVADRYGNTTKPVYFNTFWAVYKLCISIGILYDHQLTDEEIIGKSEGYISGEEKEVTVPRTMFNRNIGEMIFFFQSAILSSQCVEFEEKDRLYLAFSEDISEDEMEGEDHDILLDGVSEEAIQFDKIKFLEKFANYGAVKLHELIAKNKIETMENIANFLVASYNGETDELVRFTEVEELQDDDL